MTSRPSPVPDPAGQAQGDKWGFISHHGDDPAAAGASRQQMLEALDKEAFARLQRSRALSESPRPLTDSERAVLRRAVAPLMADLAASGMNLPDICEEAHEEREAASVCGWIRGPGGTGQGISVLLDTSAAAQIAQLAEQFQNWAADQLHDARRPPEWPACSQHASAPHRLEPQVRDDRAVWTCWRSGQMLWPIGELAVQGGARPIRGGEPRA